MYLLKCQDREILEQMLKNDCEGFTSTGADTAVSILGMDSMQRHRDNKRFSLNG